MDYGWASLARQSGLANSNYQRSEIGVKFCSLLSLASSAGMAEA